ncbi:hypothetical protein ZWY2020_002535 [Hordeum vulgare]|nr:hypothetical protein ZWY2020_002535 [Hordeum vulgare]
MNTPRSRNGVFRKLIGGQARPAPPHPRPPRENPEEGSEEDGRLPLRQPPGLAALPLPPSQVEFAPTA